MWKAILVASSLSSLLRPSMPVRLIAASLATASYPVPCSLTVSLERLAKVSEESLVSLPAEARCVYRGARAVLGDEAVMDCVKMLYYSVPGLSYAGDVMFKHLEKKADRARGELLDEVATFNFGAGTDFDSSEYALMKCSYDAVVSSSAAFLESQPGK